MKCLSPLAASMFADGEAGPAETRAVTLHLAECARCRELVEALKRENVVLAEVVREVEEQAAAPQGMFDSWIARGLLAGGVVLLGARLAWQSFSLETPPEMQWVNSMGEGSWWQVLFTTGFYLSDNATEILKMITTVAVFAVVVFLFASTAWLMRRRGLDRAMLMVLVAAVLGTSASAMEHRTGKIVTLGANETIHDSIVISGETVNVDGTVDGDLILFCRQGTVRGKIQGNLISFTRNVQIEGEVAGSTFTFAQWATLRGHAGRNWFAFAQMVSLPSGGRVESNVVAFANETDIQGSVSQDLTTASETASLSGNVGRNVTAHAKRMTIAAPARIGGNLETYLPAPNRPDVGDGVTIEGKREMHEVKHQNRYTRPSFYVFQAGQLVAAWIIGMLLFWLAPGMLSGAWSGGAVLGRRLGFGFLLLIGIPVAIIVIAITLVGIPLALITLVLWLIAIYLAKIFVAGVVGRALLGPTQPGLGGFALPLFLGLLLFFVIGNIPFVGGLVKFGVVLLGLGMAYEWVNRNWVRRVEPVVA